MSMLVESDQKVPYFLQEILQETLIYYSGFISMIIWYN